MGNFEMRGGQSESEYSKQLSKEEEEYINKLESFRMPSDEIEPEPWTDFPDEHEGLDERPDVNGVPQTLWRGERLYLDNIDELGKRDITLAGREATHNRQGETFCARDKKYASTYAVGTDGVTFYDGVLPKEQIPIGVVYKIDNTDNKFNAAPTGDEPEYFGAFEGKFREFTINESIPPESYSVEEVYVMDDFDQQNGHKRSDFRRPREVYKVRDQKDLSKVIDTVKKRMDELDQRRQAQTGEQL